MSSRRVLATAISRPLCAPFVWGAAGPSSAGLRLARPGGAAAPAPPRHTRTLLTRRATSFWAPSYSPHSDAPGSALNDDDHPAPPPLPAPSAVTEPAPKETGAGVRSRRREKYLDSLMDRAGEMGLKCSILDAQGNWTAEEGTYRKMDLCRAHDLDPRDLRKLDSLNPSLVPVILTRKSCILISIQHLRALIKPDRVIIFNAPGTEDSDAAKRFKAHLQANVRSGLAPRPEEFEDGEEYGLPYEHRALESILVDTANALEEEMGFIRRLVENLLENFEHDIDRENLRRLLHYSRRLAGFQTRAKSIKSGFDELLDSDEDLSAMYITDRMRGRPRAEHDHEQLELLVESFTKQVEEIISEIDTTVLNMQSTQEVAELMLDSGRNALLALDIKVSMVTLGVGAAALIPCYFGMNLVTGWEEAPYAFWIASGASAAVALFISLYGIKVLRKVRHVSLISKPSSLPQSVREAKERFVRERAEAARWRAAQEEAQCSAVAAATTAKAQGSPAYAKGIPDYEVRWGQVRRSLRSRASLWDRIFRPHLLRRSLLGMKRASPAAPAKAVPDRKPDSHLPPSPPSSPMAPPSRPTSGRPGSGSNSPPRPFARASSNDSSPLI